MGTIQIDGSTPKLTIGNATAEDATILFDGNAQDFYIALDDSADDLLIGLGSTVGTTPAIAIDENLKVNIPVTTASTSASTGSLTTGGGAGIGADLYVGDDAYLITDSAVLGFGADKDTLLTHTDGTGLTLNSTNKLCFNDASQFVQGSSATVLSIGATDEIDLTATAVDLNGTLDVSGNSQFSGTITVGVDDTGKDVKLFGASAGAYALWDESANLLDLRGATAAGPGNLKLTTGELTVVDADVLGKIEFQAPLEGSGTDAILVGASIWAEADDTFAAGVNNTDLVFALGKSEAAAEKFRFTADNEIGIAGANYGTDGQVLTSGGAGAACAWEDAGGGAWSLISSVTLSSSAADVDIALTGSHKIYKVVFYEVVPENDSVQFEHAFTDDAFSTANQQLHSGFIGVQVTSPSTSVASSNGSEGNTGQVNIGEGVGNGADEGCSGILYYGNMRTTTIKAQWWGHWSMHKHDDSITSWSTSGVCTDAVVMNGIKYIFSGGDIESGTFKLYGLA